MAVYQPEASRAGKLIEATCHQTSLYDWQYIKQRPAEQVSLLKIRLGYMPPD
jgi:hypothetical protein